MGEPDVEFEEGGVRASGNLSDFKALKRKTPVHLDFGVELQGNEDDN